LDHKPPGKRNAAGSDIERRAEAAEACVDSDRMDEPCALLHDVLLYYAPTPCHDPRTLFPDVPPRHVRGQEKRGMATMITEECINCGACEPECPNTAIYEGGVQFEAPDGAMHDALTEDIYYIVPQKCTECVGFFDQEQCAAVCPVDCCIPNPEIPETEDVLLARAKALHADVQIPEPPPSRFRR
jgi:ferredoxin